MDYKNIRKTFVCRGLQLTRHISQVEEGKFVYLKNVRSVVDGSLETRPGLARLHTGAATATPLHSVRRLNNLIPGATNSWAQIIGGGSNLYSDNADHTALVARDSGYSGNPLSLISFRPDQSPEPWMYVGDSARMRKIKADGTNYGMGIAPPLSAPAIEAGRPVFKIVNDGESASGWAAAGTAGAPAVISRVSTTITRILYDAGNTGFASIQPAGSIADIQPGTLIKIGAGATLETVLVTNVLRASPTTTIEGIDYDSGATGLCTIHLASTPHNLVSDSLLFLSGTEAVRVISVTSGRGGNGLSLRTRTNSTHIAGASVAGLTSFRAYTVNTHASGAALATGAVSSTVTAGNGHITFTAALDLSNVGGRPLTDADDIHLSIRLDSLANLSEGYVLFDVDAATNDFTRNYYLRAFRPHDLYPVTSQQTSALAARQREIQRRALDRLDGTTASEQTALGANQWTELRFKVGELTRVGSDISRGLANVAAVRITLVTTGSVTIACDSWWLGGTYGPDTNGNTDFYRYRTIGRSSLTGALSNPSPSTRHGLDLRRQRATVRPQLHPDPQVDRIDIYRKGGTVPSWRLVGTVDNAGTPFFNDDLSDGALAFAPELEFDNYQPFPSADLPRKGTCRVVGTSVTLTSGDGFNTAWSPGTLILIDGVAYTLYGSPSAADRLHLVENAGFGENLKFYVPEATILGQPLPAMWGPLQSEQGLTMFACGDPRQPGTLFRTKANNPDSAPDTATLEITSGSEILVNGCIFDGRGWLFSSERYFAVYPQSDGSVTVNEVPNGRGLYARYCLAVGTSIWFLGRDGIYETKGGEPVSITDRDLAPLFPRNGQPGEARNGIDPPDMTQADKFQLHYCDGLLYFNYLTAGGARQTLVYDTRYQAWYFDAYQPGIVCHYSQEGPGVRSLVLGGEDGHLYEARGHADASNSAIRASVRTPSLDGGDSRMRKRWGDLAIDCEPRGVDISITPGFEDHTELLSPLTLPGTSRAGQHVLDFESGRGRAARNISLDLSWTSSVGSPRIYEWQPSFVVDSEETLRRATNWDTSGYDGAKFVQGCVIEADTNGTLRELVIEYDAHMRGPVLSAMHNGRVHIPYSFTPFVAHAMRLVPEGQIERSVEIFGVRWIWEPMPELAVLWQTQATSHTLAGFQHLRDTYIALISTSDVTLTITIDNEDFTYSLPSTAGQYKKYYVSLRARKGRTFAYKLESSQPFRLFQKDSQVRVREWGAQGPYLNINPFGDVHFQAGARI